MLIRLFSENQLLLTIRLDLEESHLGSRTFQSQLLGNREVEFRRRFSEEAIEFLSENFSSKEYEELAKPNSTIIFRSVSYQAGEILETMLAEIEKLRALLPYAEKVHQQLASS